ncbi:DUF1732 domain-containing protein [Candidatus Babeliales bacterium]|nr:DUF1732 domain-containing protein [Candidatus Babeliales bacterium]
MFLSMTGFGFKTVTLTIEKGAKISLTVEIKAINSRFFESVCRLPSFLHSSEIKINRSLKEKLLRGRIYLAVNIVEEDSAFEKIIPSLRIVEGYIKAIDKIKNRFKISGKLTVSDILSLPNVFVSGSKQIDSKLENSILKIIDQVADLVVKSRATEGKSLCKDFEKRFLICSQKISQIKNLFSKLMKEKKDEIKKFLAIQENGNEEVKLKLDELYSTINKIDVHEEIVRFDSHIKNVKNVIKDKNIEKGKRIDFMLQELMRESNTILAKCSHFQISSLAVDIKVELEKSREQAQNIV